ncbi:GNAT family N-acetyltransferase [Streptomyces sp. NPDC026092]|uniref:GNAT family N-acetyltransferase n=1 Tax=Streptomyces sp. NPDC026092 TaxID=3154797 RepID=UPI0033F91E00
MTTAPPRQAPLSPRALTPLVLPAPPVAPDLTDLTHLPEVSEVPDLPGGGPRVRTARPEDAEALAALSLPFVRSGALRERPLCLYADQASDFLVAESPGGTLDGCLGLRTYAADKAGVLYNFCVAGHRQGCGTGARLLRAALTKARTRSLRTLFTATTGGGDLFLRHGFTPTHATLAPPAWAQSLDPRRNARILARAL